MTKDKTPTKKVEVKVEAASSTTETVTVKNAVVHEKTACGACVGGLYTKNAQTGEQVICKLCNGTTQI